MLKSKTAYFFILPYLAFNLLFASCKREASPYPDSMVRAERLMNQYPDSARKLLIAFRDSLAGLPEETGMYYHLLSVKANDKSYVRHTSDSLILRIVRYYERQTDRDKLMESYYYAGRVYRDLQDALHALEYYQKAIDVSGDTKRYDIVYLIYSHLGSLLTYQSAYDEAMSVLKVFNEYAILTKDSSKLYAPYRDMARVYSVMGKTDSAMIYYQKALQLTKEAKDDIETSGVLVEQSGIYLDLNWYDEALICLRAALPHSTDRDRKHVYSALGDYFFHINELDSSAYYYQKGLNSDNLYVRQAAYRHLTLIEKRKSNESEAALYFKGWLGIRDSLRKITPTESVCKAQALYNYQKINAENRRLKLANAQKKLCIVEILAVSFLFLGVVFFFIRRIRLKKEAILRQEKSLRKEKEAQYKQSLDSIEENKKEIERLSLQLQEAEKEKDDALGKLLKNQKELLEITNQEVLAKRKNKEMQEQGLACSDIYVRFHAACHDATVRLNEDDWRSLQEELDAKYDGFTVRLYDLYPHLSEIELQICCLMKISISVTQMSMLLGRSKSSISTARTRLYKKFFEKDGKPEDLDVFIADL